MSGQVGFDELRDARKGLREAVASHADSILWFKHPDEPWFIREAADHDSELASTNRAPLRHLSSTATCLESLCDLLEPQNQDFRTAAGLFADRALAKDDNDTWSSEKAAHVYCRVRTLTPILALAPDDVIAKRGGAIEKLVTYVWNRVDPSCAEKQGVAEAPQGENGDSPNRQEYPPNAFHTYWAIRMLKEWQSRASVPSTVSSEIEGKRAVAELWARQMLATQTVLIRSGTDRVDAHQLAWALSTEFLGSENTPVTASSPRLDLYRAALGAYFDAQLDSGGWPLYEPLFHYPAAGNAYCYTFETLATLLRPALHERGGTVLRTLLHPYLPNLLKAWEFTERTKIELAEGVRGWCSGHHPHRISAEAWATASVFSYLQKLRCLVGYWTREEAAVRRRVRRPTRLGKPAAEFLGQRGDLWTEPGGWSPGRQLAGMFLHPIQCRVEKHDWIDPDRPLIREEDGFSDGQDQARSAILFGPPGTGKTTLVEALAGAIDWSFVEVLASDFLSEGMDKVPAKADEIFDQLMELDRCVVLFDEIDELIRKRDDESDPFGRFLTTSMLPKLAKLWDQRRVLFFVATNDVDAADPAIKRTQRFDARIFAAPPAFHVKRKLLTKILKQQGKKYPSVLKHEAVMGSLQAGYGEEGSYGVFALLRFDQISEFASRMIAESNGADAIPAAAVRAALAHMGKQLRSVEWQHSELDPYELYRHHRDNESFDGRMMRLMRFTPHKSYPPGLEQFERYAGYAKALSSFAPELAQNGQWQIRMDESVYFDQYWLDFSDAS